jgi:predicted Zn-dependent protease
MIRFPLAALALALFAAGAHAQAPAGGATEAPAAPSAMDSRLFYELLLGEINARNGAPTEGFALVLDAARRNGDSALYQRAVEIALQARSGDAALQAARAWKQAQPRSREANRYVLQLLVALNRLAETAEPLKTDIALADAKDRNAALAVVPRIYARATDKAAAAAVVEQALRPYLQQKDSAAAAWTTVGRMRLAASDSAGAIDAARRAQAIDARAEGPALLALELMDPKQPEAEPLVKRYLQGQPMPELRMAYARVLVDAQRYGEAAQQLQAVTAQKPEYAEAWLVLGSLQQQENQDAAAEASLKRYLELAQAQPSEDRSRGFAQAYLALSRIAEKRKDYALANAWLDKIENPQQLVAAQQLRASLLARQGKLEEGRKLLRALPERDGDDARQKLLAEAQLLRDNKAYKAAFDLLGQATSKPPFDADLVYDRAMIAEKMNDLAEMEQLLRQVIATRPDYHHAYNALGYSFADRSIRLPEAKQLIQKALSFAPGDPFISDSLAWVEFRMGNKAEALRILEAAYKERPDAEIAAHLGEVLWSLGQRERAETVWKEGLLINSENDTLQETLGRLRVKP